jgi:dephospho-CoA kinase
MRIIGLTGGLGSGKSTVSQMLRDLGATVVDADADARDALAPGSGGAAQAIAAFGPEIADAAGHIDRQRLADIVFADPAARARLNAIVHPFVRARMAEAIDDAARRGLEAVVADIPLLYESHLEAGTAEVWVVWVPEEVQVRRAVARGMREDDARARIAAQMPLAEKRARATRVIDNSGSLQATRDQVETAWRSATAG